MRNVVNNIGGSRRWLINSYGPVDINKCVVRKCVDDTHDIVCSLCELCLAQRCVYTTIQVAE